MVNSNRIKGRIVELGKTQDDCARAIGVKLPTFNQKVNNIRAFTLTEAQKLSLFLKIDDTKFSDYFFTE